MNSNERGLDALRAVLQRLRDEEQDGYDHVRKGKFVAAEVLRPTVAELNDLFAFVDMVPDPIQINGDCDDCVYGNAHGGDLGWSQPCCSCSRPKMTHFVPLTSVLQRSLTLTANQAQMLTNLKNRDPWITGIATAPPCTEERHTQVSDCHRIELSLKARDMMIDGLSGKRLTRKGLLALDHHKKKAA